MYVRDLGYAWTEGKFFTFLLIFLVVIERAHIWLNGWKQPMTYYATHLAWCLAPAKSHVSVSY